MYLVCVSQSQDILVNIESQSPILCCYISPVSMCLLPDLNEQQSRYNRIVPIKNLTSVEMSDSTEPA